MNEIKHFGLKHKVTVGQCGDIINANYSWGYSNRTCTAVRKTLQSG